MSKCHHCGLWWSSTVRCSSICSYSDGKVRVPYLYSTGTLTHWGRVTHICVSKQTIIGSDNGLSPSRRQTIIWTNVRISLIRTLGTNFSEILSEIHKFSFRKIHFKMSSGKWRPSCFGLNVLIHVLMDKMAAISQTIFSEVFWWMTSFVFWKKIAEVCS